MRKSIFVVFVVVVLLAAGMTAFAVSGHEAGSANPPASTSVTVKATVNVYQWYDVTVWQPSGQTIKTLVISDPSTTIFPSGNGKVGIFAVIQVASNYKKLKMAVSVSGRAGAAVFGNLKSHITTFDYGVTQSTDPGVLYEYPGPGGGTWHSIQYGTPTSNSLDYTTIGAYVGNGSISLNGKGYDIESRIKTDYGAPAGKYLVTFTVHFQAIITF